MCVKLEPKFSKRPMVSELISISDFIYSMKLTEANLDLI